MPHGRGGSRAAQWGLDQRTPDRLSPCHPERRCREGSLGGEGMTILAGGSAPAPPSGGPAVPRTPCNGARSVPDGPLPCPWRARSLRRRDAAGWVAATWPWGWYRNAVGLGSPHRHAVGASQCGRPQCNRRHGVRQAPPPRPRRLSACHPEPLCGGGSLRGEGETLFAGGSAPAPPSGGPAAPCCVRWGRPLCATV